MGSLYRHAKNLGEQEFIQDQAVCTQHGIDKGMEVLSATSPIKCVVAT